MIFHSNFPSLFLRPILLENSIVLFQECRCIEAVRASLMAGIAVLALFNQFHLCRPFLGKVDTVRSTFQEEAHPGTVVDLNTRRTGHAIAAATAELARELGAFLLNLSP